MNKVFKMRFLITALMATFIVAVSAACTTEVEVIKEVVVEKPVTREVEVEKLVFVTPTPTPTPVPPTATPSLRSKVLVHQIPDTPYIL